MKQNKLKGLRFSIVLLIIFFLQTKFHLKGQTDYPFDIHFFEFINYDKNIINFPGDSIDFERFFMKIDTLMLLGKGKIKIVHIGGSHVQADVYPGRMRQRLQTFYPGMNGGRGLVFPYKLAQTNTPSGYKWLITGEWTPCRNVENNKSCNLGISGITATTSDSLAGLKLNLVDNGQLEYSFDKVVVFHSFGNDSFHPKLDSMDVERIESNPGLGYTVFYLKRTSTTLNFSLEKTDSIQNHFELYGMSLENDDPGFVYHSCGINGASFHSFLKCNLLEKQLKALNPDMIIISLGTNDAYTTKFKPEIYKANYEQMIAKIKRAVPKVAILNTVANDSYLFRRYPNKNTQLAAEVIYGVAKKYNCGVWDFYEIMGGFNSSKQWLNQNLMGRDLIHFNLEGYLLKGDLFFNAFLRAYDNHMIGIKNK